MTPPDFDLLDFIKTFIWLPALAIAGWAWTRNQKEHDDLWAAHESTRKDTSNGHSVLNDKLMEYVDSTLTEVKDENRRRTDKINDHITKLFENAEHDRAVFRQALAEHSKASSDRHIELLKGQQEIVVALHQGLAGKADK